MARIIRYLEASGSQTAGWHLYVDGVLQGAADFAAPGAEQFGGSETIWLDGATPSARSIITGGTGDDTFLAQTDLDADITINDVAGANTLLFAGDFVATKVELVSVSVLGGALTDVKQLVISYASPGSSGTTRKIIIKSLGTTKFQLGLEGTAMTAAELATDFAAGFTVDAANVAPIFTANGAAGAAITELAVSIDENSAAATTVVDLSTYAYDPDASDTLTYTLAGTDASAFTLTGSVLKITASPDFETKASYEVTITVTDSKVATTPATITLTINVADVNDVAPTISSGATGTITLPENTEVPTTTTVYEAAGTPDVSGDTIVWSLDGTDAALFSISNTGVVTFAAATTPDFETKPTYVFNVVATVGTQTATQAVTISVTDVNDAPVINEGDATDDGALAVNVGEGVRAVATLTATDADSDGLTYALSGDNADLFDVSATGVVTFKTEPVFSSTAADNVKTFTLTVTDDGTGTLTDSVDVTVTITNVNEAPVFTEGDSTDDGALALDVVEGTTAVTTLAATDADAGTTLVYSISGGADMGLFEITSGTTDLVFKAAPDFEAPGSDAGSNTYIVEVTVSDGTLSDTLTITVTVTNANDVALDFDATVTPIVENVDHSSTPADAAVLTATDDSGATVSYKIVTSLTDSTPITGGVFSIVTDSTGRNLLRYTGPAINHEATASLMAFVEATSSDGDTVIKAVTVGVTDANDAPVVDVNKTDIYFNAGETSITLTPSVLSVSDEDGDTITFTLTGPDVGALKLSGTTIADGGTFTMADVTAGRVTYEPASGQSVGSLALNYSDGTFTSTTPLEVRFNLRVVTTKTGDGDNTIDLSALTAGQQVITSDGQDTVTDGQGDDYIETGRGDDVIKLSTGGSDTVVYNFESEDDGFVSIDGNNRVSDFTPGDDKIVFKTDSAETEITTLDAFLKDGQGTSGDNFADDKFIVTIDYDISGDPAVLTFTGITFHFRESAVYGGNKLSMPIFEIKFASALAVTEDLITSLGGSSNLDVDRGLALKKLVEVDGSGNVTTNYVANLLGEDSIDFTQGAPASVNPVITSGDGTIDENTEYATTATIYTATGSAASTITWTLKDNGNADDAGDFTITSAGVVAFKETTTPDHETKDAYTFTLIATANSLTTEKVITIAVTDVNEAPVINEGDSTDDGTRILTVAEGSATVATFAATDPDDGDNAALTYALSGDDAALFQVDGDGVVTFKAPPTFDTATASNNTKRFTLTVSDNDATSPLTDSVAVTVTISNENKAPVFNSTGAAGGTNLNVRNVDVAENTPKTTILFDAGALAYDAEGADLTYSLSGTDAEDFEIDVNTGELTFAAVPNFEDPVDADTSNDYTVVVTVTDPRGETDTLTVNVTVTDANDPGVANPIVVTGTPTANAGYAVVGDVLRAGTINDPDGAVSGQSYQWQEYNETDSTWKDIASATAETYTVAGSSSVVGDAGKDIRVVTTYTAGGFTGSEAISPTITIDAPFNGIIHVAGPDDIDPAGGVDLTAVIGDTLTAVIELSAGADDNPYTYKYAWYAPGGSQPIAGATSSTIVAAATGEYIVHVTATDTVTGIVFTGFSSNQAVVGPAPTAPANPVINEGDATDDGALAVIVAEGVTAVTTIEATDVNVGDTLSYTLTGGRDMGLFAIDETTGALTFKAAPDYETPGSNATPKGNEYIVIVTVTDSSSGALTDTVTVTVTVTDANDIAPTITSGATGDALAENTEVAPTTAIYEATGTFDVDAIVWSLKAGSDTGLSIDSGTGAVTFDNATTPDHETKASYSFTVVATSGSLTAEQVVTIAVTDVNEAPVITKDADGGIAASTVSDTKAIATIAATDPDGDTLTYSVTDTDFEIDANTGVLTFKNPPTYDSATAANNTKTVTVTVSDGALSDTVVVTITVTAPAVGPNNAPTFVDASDAEISALAVSVVENTTAVTTLKATDADAGASLTYSITGGRDAGLFEITDGTTNLVFKTAPDFEAPGSAATTPSNIYVVEVTVTDGTDTDVLTLTVTVTDANDVAPTITSGATGAALAENTEVPATTAIYTATGTFDVDAIVWSLKADSDSGLSIDSGTGAVTFDVATTPDHETKASYSFTVVATSGSLAAVEQAVTIAVTDLNDVAPTITSGATGAALTENTEVAATTAIYTATGTFDVDAIVWSLKADSDSGLSIDSGTGAVTFDDATTPDYETKASYSFTVVATSGSLAAVEQAVTIAVTDVNESGPTFTSGATGAALAENTEVGTGTAVYTAGATPATAGKTITYSLSNAGDASSFSIDGTSGAVTFTVATTPDHEMKASYTFTVIATEADNAVTTSQVVTIAVTDLNDVAPAITSGATGAALAENTEVGATTAIYTATGTFDVDAIVWSLKADSDSGLSIDSGTGAVTFDSATTPDHETKASYSFTVVATSGSLAAVEQAVTIAVTDVNDVAPTITSGATGAALAENTEVAATTAIYTATGTFDVDAIVWSLKADSDSGLSIDSGTGAVTFDDATTPDYETKASYSFTVVATSGSLASVEQAVTIAVTDVNEAGPTFTSGATGTALDENTEVGTSTAVYTAGATPAVAGKAITYSLSNAGDVSSFSIDVTSGAVTFTAATTPDYEMKASYTFTVIATEADNSITTSQVVTIAVTNVDEAGTTGAVTGSTANAGYAAIGNTLSVDDPTDLDGAITIVDYEWQESSDTTDGVDGTWAAITGQTAKSYTVAGAQSGKHVRVRTNYTSGSFTSFVISAAFVIDSAPVAVGTGLIAYTDGASGVTGTADVGDTLTAPTYTDAQDGTLDYEYVWKLGTSVITGATGATHVTTAAGEYTVTVKVKDSETGIDTDFTTAAFTVAAVATPSAGLINPASYTAIDGTGADNVLTGVANQDNIIQGGNGDDTITTIGGDDVIIGGFGIDTITLSVDSSGNGAANAETIVHRYNTIKTSTIDDVQGADAADVITGFSRGNDKFILVEHNTQYHIDNNAAVTDADDITDAVLFADFIVRADHVNTRGAYATIKYDTDVPNQQDPRQASYLDAGGRWSVEIVFAAPAYKGGYTPATDTEPAIRGLLTIEFDYDTSKWLGETSDVNGVAFYNFVRVAGGSAPASDLGGSFGTNLRITDAAGLRLLFGDTDTNDDLLQFTIEADLGVEIL